MTGEIQKNSREVIRVRPTRYGGKDLVDCRVWYMDEDVGDYKPSKKGVCFGGDLLDAVIEALQQLRKGRGNEQTV